MGLKAGLGGCGKSRPHRDLISGMPSGLSPCVVVELRLVADCVTWLNTPPEDGTGVPKHVAIL